MLVKIKRQISLYINDKFTLAFKRHNRKFFCNKKISSRVNDNRVILCEMNGMHSSHIAYSYLSNALAEKYKARIVAYWPIDRVSFWMRLEWKICCYLSLREFDVYRSFGASVFLLPKVNSYQQSRAKKLSDNILSSIKSKTDVEAIELDGIFLGDLIYDSYLRHFNRATIELIDEEFQLWVERFIGVYVFWDDYFSSHDVQAVNISHSCYANAIPQRIAKSKNIPTFESNAAQVFYLNNNYLSYSSFYEFKNEFNKLPVKTQQQGLDEAKKRMESRFSGEVGVDMPYSTKSAYVFRKEGRLIKPTSKIKVLIAAHCFFDNPHCFGKNLHTDFYEWLDFLGQITLETDYDWYIKTHPDYLLGTMEIIESFLEKYPKLQLLPADSSHHQIISEGIDFALTVYGTIACEYAALGIPVVNASVNNPHIAYNFNIHPKTLNEYYKVLKNLAFTKLDIDKKEVYEYYFMNHLHGTDNWLFENFAEMLKSVGGYSEQFTSKVYDVWMREWTPERHSDIFSTLNSFIDSGDYHLENKHIDQASKPTLMKLDDR